MKLPVFSSLVTLQTVGDAVGWVCNSFTLLNSSDVVVSSGREWVLKPVWETRALPGMVIFYDWMPSNRLRIGEYLVLIFDRLKSEIMKGRFFCFYLFWKCQRKNKSFFIIFNHQFYLISFFAHFLFTILNVKYCWDLINEYFSKTFLSSFSSLCVWGSGVSSGSG